MHDDRQGVDTERAGRPSGGLSQPHPAVTPTWVCWADYIALPDDDRRELIDGVLVEVEVPTYLHERIIAHLIGLLFAWSEENGGSVIGSGYKLRIDDFRAFMPDVQFFRAEYDALFAEQRQGLVEGAPDLVIEVISPSSRRHDRLLKLQGYADIGVPEYWLVDAEALTIERLVLAEGAYRFVGGAGGEEQFLPGSFPGLVIELRRLFGKRRSTGEGIAPESAAQTVSESESEPAITQEK